MIEILVRFVSDRSNNFVQIWKAPLGEKGVSPELFLQSLLIITGIRPKLLQRNLFWSVFRWSATDAPEFEINTKNESSDFYPPFTFDCLLFEYFFGRLPTESDQRRVSEYWIHPLCYEVLGQWVFKWQFSIFFRIFHPFYSPPGYPDPMPSFGTTNPSSSKIHSANLASRVTFATIEAAPTME